MAKLRRRGGLDVERLIHENVLPHLGVETPEFLGFASGQDEESDVLFLEYVGSTAFRASDPAHQDAAGRWLGKCHARSSCAQIPELVPRRNLDEDRVELSSTRLRLSTTLDNASMGEEGRSRVSRVVDLMDMADRRWPDWAELTMAVPPVLTHGAFVSRNVRMRGAGTTLTTLPFDWDHVAVRSPATDLARTSTRSHGFAANASLRVYQSALAANGLTLDRSVLAAIARMGTVIRAVACIGWLIGTLATQYVDGSLDEIDIYRDALQGALST